MYSTTQNTTVKFCTHGINMVGIPYPVCIHQTTANGWNGIKQSRPLHIWSEMVQNNGSVIWLFSGLGTPSTSKRCFGSGDMLHRASSSKSSAFIQWIPFFPVGHSQLSSEVASCSQLQINPSMEPQICTTEKHRGQAWGPWCFSKCTYSNISISATNGKKTFLCQYAKSADGTALNFLLHQTSTLKITSCRGEGNVTVDEWEQVCLLRQQTC